MTLGGYTALSTKGVASLLSGSLWRALTFPITYLLVLVLVATALLQIRYVNRALQRFDSTQVIPTQFVLFTISVIIGSAILYRDFESATVERVAKFAGGCALTFLGVYLITSGRPRGGEDDQQGPGEDEEGGIGLIDEEAQAEDARDDYGAGRNRRKSMASVTFYDGPMEDGVQDHSRKGSQARNSIPPTTQRHDSTLSSATSRSISPRNAAVETPLLENAWQSRKDYQGVRRSMQSTISSPQLPTSDNHLLGPSATHGQDPENIGSPVADRPSTLSRHSMSRMMPGPYITPLSSSLSAIVADSLRRGVELPGRRRQQRRGLSELRKSRSQRLTDSGSHEGPAPVRSPLKTAQSAVEPRSDQSSSGKGRSVSLGTSFGDFFQFHRARSSSNDDNVKKNVIDDT